MTQTHKPTKDAQDLRDDIDLLAQDARTLMADTAEMTGDKLSEVRGRLEAALDSAKDTYGRLQKKAVKGAQAADQVVRENPYQSIGIAFGVGLLLGFLVHRQSSRD